MLLNPDGLTQFGTPWEMRLIQNYLVRRKGGNLLGYSGLISFIPDLQLGKTCVHMCYKKYDMSNFVRS